MPSRHHTRAILEDRHQDTIPHRIRYKVEHPTVNIEIFRWACLKTKQLDMIHIKIFLVGQIHRISIMDYQMETGSQT